MTNFQRLLSAIRAELRNPLYREFCIGVIVAVLVCLALFIILMIVTDAPPPETQFVCPIHGACAAFQPATQPTQP